MLDPSLLRSHKCLAELGDVVALDRSSLGWLAVGKGLRMNHEALRPWITAAAPSPASDEETVYKPRWAYQWVAVPRCGRAQAEAGVQAAAVGRVQGDLAAGGVDQVAHVGQARTGAVVAGGRKKYQPRQVNHDSAADQGRNRHPVRFL